MIVFAAAAHPLEEDTQDLKETKNDDERKKESVLRVLNFPVDYFC